MICPQCRTGKGAKCVGMENCTHCMFGIVGWSLLGYIVLFIGLCSTCDLLKGVVLAFLPICRCLLACQHDLFIPLGESVYEVHQRQFYSIQRPSSSPPSPLPPPQ